MITNGERERERGHYSADKRRNLAGSDPELGERGEGEVSVNYARRLMPAISRRLNRP